MDENRTRSVKVLIITLTLVYTCDLRERIFIVDDRIILIHVGLRNKFPTVYLPIDYLHWNVVGFMLSS